MQVQLWEGDDVNIQHDVKMRAVAINYDQSLENYPTSGVIQ